MRFIHKSYLCNYKSKPNTDKNKISLSFICKCLGQDISLKYGMNNFSQTTVSISVIYLSNLNPGSQFPQLWFPSWERELLQQEHEQDVCDEFCWSGEPLSSQRCSSANRSDAISFSRASLGTWGSSGSQLYLESIIFGWER
jgi:hypothetical protein